jgi:uncharacterized protein YutE (UPF0331/DUF86 family)
MIDADLVTRKLVLVLQDVAALGPLLRVTREAFLTTPTNQALAERYLERMIGRMIDVNYHLITELGGSPPKDYYDSFLRLADYAVLDLEFARQVAGCAGLRNRIAHEYDDIDPDRIFDALPVAQRDVTEYVRQVNAYLERPGIDTP